MKLTILGTGCAWTKRECASYLIDDNIIIDPGYGSIKQLLKTNDTLLHHEKIEKIDLVLITHFHSDHYFDMPYILQKEATGRFPDDKLMIVGPSGLQQNLKDLCRLAISEHSNKKIDVDKWCDCVIAEENKVIKHKNMEIRCLRMDHDDTVDFGYIIKLPNGKVIGFTGDTCMCDNVMKMIDMCDIIVLNMADVKRSKAHYNIIEGIELMKKYQGKKCIIPAHLTSQAWDYTKDKINAPYDLMVLDLDSNLPYDFERKGNVEEEYYTPDVEYKHKEFETLTDGVVTLKASRCAHSVSYDLPTYYFNVFNEKDEFVGKASVCIGYNKNVRHIGNITTHIKQEFLHQEYEYNIYKLLRNIPKAHDINCIYISSTPNDMRQRRICVRLGAVLKEMRFFSNRDREKYHTEDLERCIWKWDI